jgi:predicted nucleotide-binding protein (sugar kinase/HSP70/actin superfamily)
LAIFQTQYQEIRQALGKGGWKDLKAALKTAAGQLKKIPLKRPPHQVPRITLAGEIFVRKDGLSRQYLTEYLATKGFAAICAPVAEWILYTDYIIVKGLAVEAEQMGLTQRLKQKIKSFVMREDERRIKKILSSSHLVHAAPVDIDAIVDAAKTHISPHLSGEAVLTVGSAMREVATETCGAIAIGPFGCMPNRISEAILMETMSGENKLSNAPHDSQLDAILSEWQDLPFLAIESDGSQLSQQTLAKLEAFCLRAGRLHQRMLRHNRPQ